MVKFGKFAHVLEVHKLADVEFTHHTLYIVVSKPCALITHVTSNFEVGIIFPTPTLPVQSVKIQLTLFHVSFTFVTMLFQSDSVNVFQEVTFAKFVHALTIQNTKKNHIHIITQFFRLFNILFISY
jgi:hypothetical protein